VIEEKEEILVISHKYPPSIGGMQKHCFELVEGLKRKYTIHKLIQTAGISKLWFFLTVVGKAKKILKDNPNISLIYVNDGLMAFVLTRLMKQTNVPMVATIHGLDVVFPLAFYQKWVRNTLSKYHAIIAVSKATQEECILRGIPKTHAFMVQNGYEPRPAKTLDHSNIIEKLNQTFHFDARGKRIIISIGRGVKRKGFSWFIKHVITKLPEEVCYLIVGPISDTKQLRRLKRFLPKGLYQKLVLFAGLAVDEVEIEEAVAQLGLGERVKRISGLSNEELTALIQLADLSVMPNVKVEGDFEGFGLVALEASSNGTLLIGAGIEGITTAIEDGVNGVLLPSGDEIAWVATITELLADHEQLEVLSQLYQQNTLAHSFSWARMVQGYDEIFMQIALKNKKL
jgi:glycosyltransferase involved in cell wall biosynthesis